MANKNIHYWDGSLVYMVAVYMVNQSTAVTRATFTLTQSSPAKVHQGHDLMAARPRGISSVIVEIKQIEFFFFPCSGNWCPSKPGTTLSTQAVRFTRVQAVPLKQEAPIWPAIQIALLIIRWSDKHAMILNCCFCYHLCLLSVRYKKCRAQVIT